MNNSQLCLYSFMHSSEISKKGEIEMLETAIVGLSFIASAVGALIIEIYVAKRISSLSTNLNHKNY